MEGDKITLEDLLERINKQDETIAKQAETIVGLKGEVAKTAISTEEAKPPTIPKDPIEFKGNKYKWCVAIFSFPGSHEKYTAEEASTDDEMLAEILKIEGQGMLKELV